MTNTLYTVTHANSDEVTQLIDIACKSFFIPDGDRPRIEKLIEVIGVDRVRVVVHEGVVVGGLLHPLWAYFFGGNSIPGSGVSLVAVKPDYRRRGVASALMQDVLDESHSLKIPVSVLMPANYDVYNKFGYEVALECVKLKANLSDIPNSSCGYNIRGLVPEDYDTVKALRKAMVCCFNGNINRSTEKWVLLLSTDYQKKEKYVFEKDGRIDGYVIIMDWKGDGGAFLVEDYAFSTKDAGLAILGHLSRYSSMKKEVIVRGSSYDPLYQLIPRLAYSDYTGRIGAMMLRLIDVASALEARGYPKSISGSVTFKVTDDTVEHNNGIFTLTVKDGKSSVEKSGSDGIEIDVRDLACMYASKYSATELKMYGKLTGSKEAINLCDTIFSGTRPWISDMF